ncbi:MAG: PHP domain-containing protein [Dehalococcoidales bacterium]|nr:PHP domain-containing protein [Dehalococcoidales bacterium]
MDKVTDSLLRKTDLHIHTPASVCYGEKSTTPEQIVTAAMAAGLEVMAVTDHNSVEAVDDIRQVAVKKGLAVFPGIEISAKGGHSLAIFEMDTPVEKMRSFLDDIGIARAGWGSAETLAGGNIEGVFQKIEEHGGIAIAAHIERWPSGFLETNEPRQVKLRIHNNRYLSALEITVSQNRGFWNAGLARGFPKKYACIQGSDAHALDEIGRRPVYVRMERVSLAALRQAFLEYETRIKFPDELPRGK